MQVKLLDLFAGATRSQGVPAGVWDRQHRSPEHAGLQLRGPDLRLRHSGGRLERPPRGPQDNEAEQGEQAGEGEAPHRHHPVRQGSDPARVPHVAQELHHRQDGAQVGVFPINCSGGAIKQFLIAIFSIN